MKHYEYSQTVLGRIGLGAGCLHTSLLALWDLFEYTTPVMAAYGFVTPNRAAEP